MSEMLMFENIEADVVNHPKHYETGKFECIEVMEEVFGAEAVREFCLCNAFKYLYRCKRKENMEQDVDKAMWYLERFRSLEASESRTAKNEAVTKKTNADVIRSMSDDELYEFLSMYLEGDIDYSITFCDLCMRDSANGGKGNNLGFDCDDCRRHWLLRSADDYNGLEHFKKIQERKDIPYDAMGDYSKL